MAVGIAAGVRKTLMSRVGYSDEGEAATILTEGEAARENKAISIGYVIAW